MADEGDRTAIAPGAALLVQPGVRRHLSVSASELTASQYARELSPSGVAIVVREDGRVLGASLPVAQAAAVHGSGNVSVNGTAYRAVEEDLPGL